MKPQPGPSLLFTAVVLLLGIARASAQEPRPNLFQGTEHSGAIVLQLHPVVGRQRNIVVDLARLRGPANGKLRLPLFDGHSVVALKDRQVTPRPNTFIWVGHVA